MKNFSYPGAWLNFLSFCYYICHIPFRLNIRRDGDLEMVTCLPQKIICFGVMWPLQIIHRATAVIHNAQDIITTSAAQSFFALIIVITGMFRNIKLMWILTSEKNKVKNCFNQIISSSLLNLDLKTYKLGLIYVYSTFCMILIGPYLILLERSWPTIISRGYERFLLTPPISNMTDNFSAIEISFGVFDIGFQFIDWLQIFIESLNWALIPFVQWTAATNFFLFAKSTCEDFSDVCSCPHKIRLITDKYFELKTLSSTLNSVWGLYSLMWLLDLSLAFVFYVFPEILQEEKPFLAAVEVWEATAFAMYLFICAETDRTMTKFKRWLVEVETKCILDETPFELKGILNETRENPIGVGSTGLYRISYGFVAELVIFQITLFLVYLRNAE